MCKCFTLFHRCYAGRISFIKYFYNYFSNAPRAAQEELAGRRLATRAFRGVLCWYYLVNLVNHNYDLHNSFLSACKRDIVFKPAFKKPFQTGALFSRNMTDVVSLNVGGTIYTTSRATLTRFPDTMLGSMFSDRLPSIKDDKGNYLIDGDGSLFRYVLNFLRRSILVLPEDFKELEMLAQEADFYQIKELINAVAQIRNREEEKRAKSEHVKEQELLEVEFTPYDTFCPLIIYGSSETVQNIPVFMEAFRNRPGRHNDPSRHDNLGPEKNGFSLSNKPPLNRVEFFRQIAQLGFKIVSVSSSSDEHRTRDRWVFAREGKII